MACILSKDDTDYIQTSACDPQILTIPGHEPANHNLPMTQVFTTPDQCYTLMITLMIDQLTSSTAQGGSFSDRKTIAKTG